MIEITRKVLSYCKIPEEISENNMLLNTASCDSYIEYDVVSKKEQLKYADNFTLANWIIDNYPEVEGQKILIHIDY